VAKTHPGETIIVGEGLVLCCELHTKRYFQSSMQALQQAEVKINADINKHLYVTLDEFYDILGLEHTSGSDQFGWDSDKLLELQYTSVLGPNGVPCIAFEYNYLKAL
jgi:hypothetical protein